MVSSYIFYGDIQRNVMKYELKPADLVMNPKDVQLVVVSLGKGREVGLVVCVPRCKSSANNQILELSEVSEGKVEG